MEKNRDEIIALMSNLEECIFKYNNAAKSNYTVWKTLQIISIIAGFVTSIVAVVSFIQGPWTYFAKLICISLPFLGSAAAALISFLKPAESYLQTVNAKIEFKNLLTASKIQFSKCQSLEDYQSLFEKITLKTNEIESQQEKKF
jgi:hypothetical protein